MGHSGYSREDVKIVQIDPAFRTECFQGIGAHRTGIDHPVLYGVHDPVVGLTEMQRLEIVVGIDPFLLEFPPGHQPAAQRGFGDRHEGFAFQVVQAADAAAVPAAEDDAAVAGVNAVGAPLLQGDDAIGPVPVLHPHVKRRIGQDEVDRPGFDGRIDLIVGQRYNLEAVIGNVPGEIFRQGRPLIQALLGAPNRQHADANGRRVAGRGLARRRGAAKQHHGGQENRPDNAAATIC